jgi:hypothetical protein
MIDEAALATLIGAQQQADEIRRTFGISDPRTILFQAPLNHLDDDKVIVEADGLGSCTMRIVQGDFPIDCLVLHERKFDSEAAGVAAAESIINGSADAQDMLLEYSRRNSS